MQTGIHVIEMQRLPELGGRGVVVPAPWMGILDLLRMTEGHLPEPPEGRPLGVTGLDALLEAAPPESTPLLQSLRVGFVEARRYFDWRRIPVAILCRGRIEDARDGAGLRLVGSGRSVSLGPFLGTRLQPAAPDATGWWWAPQIG